MLPLIGTSDQVELLGYVIERCPACGTTGPLGVFETKKKITVYFIPTVPYQKNHMIECKTCHSRFILPDDMRESLGKRLISQDALSEQIRQMRAGTGGSQWNGSRSYRARISRRRRWSLGRSGGRFTRRSRSIGMPIRRSSKPPSSGWR